MKITDLIKALWQAPQAIAPSAAGNTSITIAALARRKVLTISPTAGAGAYAHEVYFPTANRITGDEMVVRIRMPASVNPTINLRSATAAGTVVKTVVGTGTAFDVLWLVVFDGSAWS
jgi:hypothetical protein